METITAIKTKNGLIPVDTYNLAVSADNALGDLYYSEGLNNSQRRSIAKARNVLDKIIKNAEITNNTDDPFI
jgi:hypothetical protein